jgi:hypothetical protein
VSDDALADRREMVRIAEDRAYGRRIADVVIPDRRTATGPGRAGMGGPWSRCLSVSL